MKILSVSEAAPDTGVAEGNDRAREPIYNKDVYWMKFKGVPAWVLAEITQCEPSGHLLVWFTGEDEPQMFEDLDIEKAIGIPGPGRLRTMGLPYLDKGDTANNPHSKSL